MNSEPVHSEAVLTDASAQVNDVSTSRASASVDPRVVWAHERTMLSWVRTGIGLIAFGFVLARGDGLLRLLGAEPSAGEGSLAFLGMVMIALGAVASLSAARRYVGTLQLMLRGEAPSFSARPAAAIAVAVATLGFALVGWVIWVST